MTHFPILKQAVVASILLLVGYSPLQAADLETPRGEVVLTVSGQVASTNVAETARFDMDMLHAMPRQSFTTTTIWTEGAQQFEGVPLKALLDAVGANGETLHMVALNDYAVDIPLEALADHAPIIAYRVNGKDISVRDKGPLWIVYPYDSDPRYRSELIYSRSIWQLDRIEVR